MDHSEYRITIIGPDGERPGYIWLCKLIQATLGSRFVVMTTYEHKRLTNE